MERLRCICAAALALALGGGASAGLTVFTSFEGISSDDFTIGTPPITAHFTGDAFSGTLGIEELYRTGDYAWMVNPGGTGLIEFETPAAEVEFWGRTRSLATEETIITAFDEASEVVGMATLEPGEDFQFITFIGEISSIEVVNMDLVHMNGIDDFGFNPIPAPGAALLIAMAGLASARRRR